MELISYILLICLSAFTLLTESKMMYKWIFIPSVMIFMFIVRSEGFDTDIEDYARQMHATGMDIYYLREFIFWFGSRFIYYVFQDEFLSFLFMDLIWIIVMIKLGNRMSSFKSENLNNALLLVLMTSFPFVFGYENIYRQFYATVFALLSYSLIDKKYYISLFFLAISFFMHNIVALLLPIFLIKRFYKFNFPDRIQISTIVSLVFVASLGLLVKLKSAEQTGLNMGMFYLLVFVLLLVVALLVYRKNIYILFEKVPSLFFIVLLMMGLVALNVDMVAERLGMMFVCFIAYDLFMYSSEIESRGIRSLVRLSLMLLFSLPTLFFESSKNFLM
jgi:hypothetical protein